MHASTCQSELWRAVIYFKGVIVELSEMIHLPPLLLSMILTILLF